MKIFLIHNYHRSGSASGDDMVFEREARLLESNGHNVIRFNPANDEFDACSSFNKIMYALQIPWSVSAHSAVRRLIAKEIPDIIHIHNFFPLISPSVYYAAHSSGLPVVQTPHDFRMLCPSAFAMRNSTFCTECIDGSFIKSVWHGCFKGSRLMSMPVAFMHKLHHMLGTYKKLVDAFVCLSEYQKALFVEAGFDADKLFVKPNFLEDCPRSMRDNVRGYVAFVGRLSEEKGLRTLISACRAMPDIPFKIIGGGANAKTFRSLADGLKNVEFTGYLPHEECIDQIGGAAFLVFPSVWPETFGLSVIEAYSRSKPVVASNIGTLPELVEDNITGLLFKAGNAQALAEKVRYLWDNEERCLDMGRNARQTYETKYAPGRNSEMLISIYEEVIRRRRHA